MSIEAAPKVLVYRSSLIQSLSNGAFLKVLYSKVRSPIVIIAQIHFFRIRLGSEFCPSENLSASGAKTTHFLYMHINHVYLYAMENSY